MSIRIKRSDVIPFATGGLAALIFSRLGNASIKTVSVDCSASVLTFLSIIVAFVGVSVTILLTSSLNLVQIFKQNNLSFKRLIGLHTWTVYSGIVAAIFSIVMPVWCKNGVTISFQRGMFFFWVFCCVFSLSGFVLIIRYLHGITATDDDEPEFDDGSSSTPP